MSLLYTLQGIKKSEKDAIHLIVALAKWNKQLAYFYTSYGFDVVKPEWIDTYEHTTALSFNLLNPISLFKEVSQRLKIYSAKNNTKKLLADVKPDLVHLNSLVLVGSAKACKEGNVPFVWHVREHPVNGLLGIRKKWVCGQLANLASKVIFICQADQNAWKAPANSEVVYNFVDFDMFNTANTDVNQSNSFTILFLGGVNRIKGTLTTLKALHKVNSEGSKIHTKMIFAGGVYETPNSTFYKMASRILWLFRLGTYTQQIERLIIKLDLEKHLIRVPYTNDVATLFAKSDCVVFPSIRPHFARPIIEAGAMRLPVIGSDLDSVRELIDEGVNGFLCKPLDFKCLSSKLAVLRDDKKLRQKFGEKGYSFSLEKFNQTSNIAQIIKIYQALC